MLLAFPQDYFTSPSMSLHFLTLSFKCLAFAALIYRHRKKHRHQSHKVQIVERRRREPWAVPPFASSEIRTRLEVSASVMLTGNFASKARNQCVLVERYHQSKRRTEEERAKR